MQNAALGIDARSGRSLEELAQVLDHMKEAGYDFEILFMDAEDSVLVKRYKETRRSHHIAELFVIYKNLLDFLTKLSGEQMSGINDVVRSFPKKFHFLAFQPGDWRAVTGNRPELSHRCQDRASQEVLCVLCDGVLRFGIQ